MAGELVKFVEYTDKLSPPGNKQLVPIRRTGSETLCYLAVSLAKDLCYKEGNSTKLIGSVIDQFEFTDEGLSLFKEYQRAISTAPNEAPDELVHHKVANSREFLLRLVEGATTPSKDNPDVPSVLKDRVIQKYFDTGFNVELKDMLGSTAGFLAELYFDMIESAYMIACSTLKNQGKRARKIRIKGYIINNPQVFKPLQAELNAFDFELNFTRKAENDLPFREVVIYKAME
jgi:hypothetical protein